MELIIGLPNAGKTSYSARFENAYHADDFRDNGIDLWELVKQEGVIIEGLFDTARVRKKLVEAASRPCVCYWLYVPVEECIRREKRGRKRWFFEMHGRDFQPPTYEEGWDEIIIIKGQGNGQETITSGTG